jgi:hypothetical protein
MDTTSELKELLERFRRGAELVAVVSTGAAGPELDFKAGEGRWSVRQIVSHLADSEMVGRGRFCQVIAEQNPTLQGYDEKAWAERLDYSKRKFSQALETFRRTRGENHDLLSVLPEEAFSRKGVHTEHGEVSLLDLLKTDAAHAEGHARQIKEARAAYKASRAQA